MDENELLVRASIADELSGPLAVIDEQLKKVTASVAELDAVSAKGAKGGLAAATVQAGEFRKMARSTHGTLLDLSRGITGAFYSATKMAVEGVGLLGAGLTVLGVKATTTFATARLGIQTFVGDVTRGNAIFAQLRGLQGPFSITDLTASAQSMLTAAGSADRLIPRMKALADIAATQADPKAALSSLADSINKIQESGTVDARVLRPMLGAGVPVYELLASELGIPTSEVKKKLASGAPIDLPLRFLTDIENEAGPLAKFKGAVDKQRATLLGQFQGIKLDAQNALADVFAPLGESLLTVTPLLRDGLGGLIRGIGPSLVSFLTSVTALVAGLLPILQPIAAALLGALGQVLQALVPSLAQLAPQMPALATSLADLVVALIPIIPPLTELTVALVPVLVLAIDDLTGALTKLITWLTPVVDWFARTTEHSRLLRDVLKDVLLVLAGYAALAKTVSIIKGIATSIIAVKDATVALKAAQSGGDILRILTGAGAKAGAGAAVGEAAGGGAAAVGAGAILPVLVTGLAVAATAALAAVVVAGVAATITHPEVRRDLAAGEAARTGKSKGALNNWIDQFGHYTMGWAGIDHLTGYNENLKAAKAVKAGTMPAKPPPWWAGLGGSDANGNVTAASVKKPAATKGDLVGAYAGLTVNGPLVHADHLSSDADVYGSVELAIARAAQQKRERGK